PRLIPSAVPLLSPFAWLCHQKWDSATAVTKIPRTTPMLFLGGKQDEIVPHEHMQMLWQITTEKCNPDGTDKKATKSIEAASTSTGGWFAQALGFGSTSSVPPATTDKPQKPEEEDHVDEEDPDLKEHSSYEIIGDKEVLVSKRTRYRTWKEFEDGKHSYRKRHLHSIKRATSSINLNNNAHNTGQLIGQRIPVQWRGARGKKRTRETKSRYRDKRYNVNVITINRNNSKPITEIRPSCSSSARMIFLGAFVYFRIFASAGDAGNAGQMLTTLRWSTANENERSHAEDMRGHK
ncbi:7672_t:CDS:2, partial [Acaulospora colombiana]